LALRLTTSASAKHRGLGLILESQQTGFFFNDVILTLTSQLIRYRDFAQGSDSGLSFFPPASALLPPGSQLARALMT
jgi:hypothetical protein